MKVLFVNPKYPDTYWSFKHALMFISKKAAYPPLGLLTVAAMVPEKWEKKLIDLNVTSLKDKDILWADLIFIGAMSVQSQSANEIIGRCKTLNKTIVAGGPLFTEEYENYSDVGHLVLNEAEITLPQFLNDLELGNPKKIYQTSDFADIKNTPSPDYSLINFSKYASLAVQYSRGCPFNCEFCDITALLGHKPRTKTTSQILFELDTIKNMGWKGSVFFVDDNFIGNKHLLKNDLLPALVHWMKKNNYPFIFTTEASINISDDPQLMELMVEAGFIKVFVGIETTEEASLVECLKTQNKDRDLTDCVKTIQSAGLEVTAGFIVGFDNDPSDIFRRQIDFIQKTGIISAMVGLLNAPKKSLLYKRLMSEGRILDNWTGDNTDYSMNFIPKMDKQKLMEGYQQIIHGIYSSKPYYKRVFTFLRDYNPPKSKKKISVIELFALFKSIFILGVYKKNRIYYWELILWSLFVKPTTFPLAVTYSIYGYHYRKVFKGLT
jgi:radical SAM superfamily enzyme YgiQ (UPF0313 family)